MNNLGVLAHEDGDLDAARDWWVVAGRPDCRVQTTSEISAEDYGSRQRAYLLEMAGDRAGARAAYEQAARQTLSEPERAYLSARAAQTST